jgi:hypothetical protein
MLAVTAPLPDLVLYGRPGCHLCEDTRAILNALLARRTEAGRSVPAIVERNIEDDPGWHRRFVNTIPVVVLGEHELELATSPRQLERLLANGLDEGDGLDSLGGLNPGDTPHRGAAS